jgi:tripartite-type tricarboxylate transporter receptor subunit TctC
MKARDRDTPPRSRPWEEKAMLRMLIAAVVVAASALAANAQTSWPDRPVTFVVSNGAGSSPDVMARLLGSKLEPLLGQSIVVETKPGAGNVIGAMNVVRAAPDGYRIFFATSAALAANPFMLKTLPYDPLKDFEPVAYLGRTNQFILVHKDVPANTLDELIALDRKKPGAMSIAIDGLRNLAGVTAQALNFHAGTKFVYVAYPNIMNGLQDLVAGRVQVGVFPVAIAESFVREGAIKPLAIAGLKRIKAFPDVPAAADRLPGFDFSGWFVLMAPRGTPREIVEKLNRATDKAMRDPQIVAMAPKLGYDFGGDGVGSPEDARKFIESQLGYWAKTTKELGIEPE